MSVIHYDIEIRECADKYDLPYGLIAAIIRVESSGNTWAMRYEPTFMVLLNGKQWPVFGAVSHDTEVHARSTSWGLMQVMGQVARERGFEGVFLSELCKPQLGIEYGCRQLAFFRQRYFDRDGWNGVISSYNQGGPRRAPDGDFLNSSYVRKVRNIWA